LHVSTPLKEKQSRKQQPAGMPPLQVYQVYLSCCHLFQLNNFMHLFAMGRICDNLNLFVPAGSAPAALTCILVSPA
jgi:hypothetical protein